MRGGKRSGAGRKIGSYGALKAEITQLAQNSAADAVRVLIDIMHNEDAPFSVRYQSAIALLDRAIGKPYQSPTEPYNTDETQEKPKGLTPEAAQSIRSDILGVPNE